MKCWLKIVAAGVLLVPVLAGGLVATALRTEVGAGWLLGLVRERVPGLEYAHHEGSLADGVTLQGPRFRQDGLEAGADDYVVKPFKLKELVARVKAVLRRTRTTTSEQLSEPLVFDGLSIDQRSREVVLDGEDVAAVLVGDVEEHLAIEGERVQVDERRVDAGLVEQQTEVL